jgi:hypothetical protein
MLGIICIEVFLVSSFSGVMVNCACLACMFVTAGCTYAAQSMKGMRVSVAGQMNGFATFMLRWFLVALLALHCSQCLVVEAFGDHAAARTAGLHLQQHTSRCGKHSHGVHLNRPSRGWQYK